MDDKIEYSFVFTCQCVSCLAKFNPSVKSFSGMNNVVRGIISSPDVCPECGVKGKFNYHVKNKIEKSSDMGHSTDIHVATI